MKTINPVSGFVVSGSGLPRIIKMKRIIKINVDLSNDGSFEVVTVTLYIFGFKVKSKRQKFLRAILG